MAQLPIDHNHLEHAPEGSFGAAAVDHPWVEMNHGFASHPSPLYEQSSFHFLQQMHHQQQPQSMPAGVSDAFVARMGPPPPTAHHHAQHQQLLPLIVPTHPTWPSMLTHSAAAHPLSAPPVAIPPMSLPGKPTKLNTLHATPSPRKTLTDNDRRRMCQYHEDNPTVKQTEIGGATTPTIPRARDDGG